MACDGRAVPAELDESCTWPERMARPSLATEEERSNAGGRTPGSAARSGAPRSYVAMFHLGGAVARAPREATAYSGRDVDHNIEVKAKYDPETSSTTTRTSSPANSDHSWYGGLRHQA